MSEIFEDLADARITYRGAVCASEANLSPEELRPNWVCPGDRIVLVMQAWYKLNSSQSYKNQTALYQR